MEKWSIADKCKHVALRTAIVALINLMVAYGISWIQGELTIKNYSTILTYISFIYLVIGPAALVGQDQSGEFYSKNGYLWNCFFVNCHPFNEYGINWYLRGSYYFRRLTADVLRMRIFTMNFLL